MMGTNAFENLLGAGNAENFIDLLSLDLPPNSES